MKKTLLSLLAAVLAMLLLAGCLQAKTKEYTWPVELINLSGMSQEETKKSIESVSPKMAEKITINDDGSVTLFCTEEQRLLWLEEIELFFVENIPEYLEKYFISIVASDDKTSVKITANPETMQMIYLIPTMLLSVAECYVYQLFSNTPQEECFVEYTIINETTGKIVASAIFPGEELTLTPEDWE